MTETTTETETLIELSEEERTPCEIYTRVMGYHHPVSCYNTGKQQERSE